MSTRIADLTDDDNSYKHSHSRGSSSSSNNSSSWGHTMNKYSFGAHGCCRHFLLAILAAYIVLQMPGYSLHEYLPQQAFYFGDASVQAVLVALVLALLEYLMKMVV